MLAPLDGVDDVVVSRSGNVAWFHWYAGEYELKYPHRDAVVRSPAARSSARSPVRISLECSAVDLPSMARGWRAVLWLPPHPEDSGVYLVYHPMYWILGLTGYEFDETPVEATLAPGFAFAATLARRRIDYSFANPDLEMVLPGPAVAAALAAGAGATLAAAGEATRVRLRLDRAPALARAVRFAMPRCAR